MFSSTIRITIILRTNYNIKKIKTKINISNSLNKEKLKVIVSSSTTNLL